MNNEQVKSLRVAYDKLRKHTDRQARYLGDSFITLYRYRNRYPTAHTIIMHTMDTLHGKDYIDTAFADRLEAMSLLREILREQALKA